MTPLESLLIQRIAATGPIPLSDYMADCLLHPEHGYYTGRDPFGARGDFTTAPEISQMFGELLGLCLAQAWLDQGAPSRFTLAELGPGRGTLMADVLRATRQVPGFHRGMRVLMIEASPRLRETQASVLAGYSADWAEGLPDLSDDPLFLLANEFFDALPVRQFTRTATAWQESMVGLVEGALALGRAAPLPLGSLEGRLADTKPGDVVEICPQAAPIIAQIAAQIERAGGLALIIDYGGWQSLGDTVQAVQAHGPVPITHAPGQADLTAHVDFKALAQAAQPCAAYYTPQGELLLRLGIEARAERLAAGLTGAALESHLAATRRLTAPSEMGNLFKALALTAPSAPLPPGFA